MLVSVVGLGQLYRRFWLFYSFSAESFFTMVKSISVKVSRVFTGRMQGSGVKKGLQPQESREFKSIPYALPAPLIEENCSSRVPSSRISLCRRWSKFNSLERPMSFRSREGHMEREKLRIARQSMV